MKHLKQEFDKLTFKETVTYFIASITLTAGFVLLFMGMFIPPEGEIHDSVLTAFGLILLFVGSLLGVSMHYTNETNKFKSSVMEAVNRMTAEKREEE